LLIRLSTFCIPEGFFANRIEIKLFSVSFTIGIMELASAFLILAVSSGVVLILKEGVY
jgi:hypothetical protein